MSLRDKIAGRIARVGVIGLGYVGLPLVRLFAQGGYPVLGFDIDEQKVRRLRAGQSYIKHIPSEHIQDLVASGRFEATANFDRLDEPDVVVICVPTPLNEYREPDLTAIVNTGEAIARKLRREQLIVLESTTYPGTTDELLQPILEKSGLRAGKDFYLAYSPEREDPGNPRYTAGNIPKVVGAINPESLEVAVAFYGSVVVQVVPVSSTRAAEACKILENTYRAVNIALVNELKVLFQRMGIDIWEVIAAASTKPFGFQPFYPGPGLGGHCIPIDPFYLTWVARKYDFTTRFIELAGEINTSMPRYVVQKVAEYLNDQAQPLKGSKILVLGVAYKKDVDDPRESPSFVVMELLLERGAIVHYNDPYIPRLPRMRHHSLEMESLPLTEQTLRSHHCVLILTDHSVYDWHFIVQHAPLVVDTRNATARVREGRHKIRFA
jgi:UDP-N-acetyl-D-glucosamine dehydrogenase